MNIFAISVTTWNKACEQKLDRWTSHIEHTKHYRQFGNVGDNVEDCLLGLFSRMHLLQVSCRNQNQHREVCYEFFSESEHSVQSPACARTKRSFWQQCRIGSHVARRRCENGRYTSAALEGRCFGNFVITLQCWRKLLASVWPASFSWSQRWCGWPCFPECFLIIHVRNMKLLFVWSWMVELSVYDVLLALLSTVVTLHRLLSQNQCGQLNFCQVRSHHKANCWHSRFMYDHSREVFDEIPRHSTTSKFVCQRSQPFSLFWRSRFWGSLLRLFVVGPWDQNPGEGSYKVVQQNTVPAWKKPNAFFVAKEQRRDSNLDTFWFEVRQDTKGGRRKVSQASYIEATCKSIGMTALPLGMQTTVAIKVTKKFRLPSRAVPLGRSRSQLNHKWLVKADLPLKNQEYVGLHQRYPLWKSVGEDKIQESSDYLFWLPIGHYVMDQRSGDGRFIGRVEILAINCWREFSKFWDVGCENRFCFE